MDFTISSDPECFIRDEDWITRSFIKYTKGTKEKPVILPSGGGLQADGVALEIAMPVFDSVRSFIRGINLNFTNAKKVLPKGYSLSFRSSSMLLDEELTDPKASIVGCSPDFNAWSMSMNKLPKLSSNLRTCGGHVHVGVKDGSLDDDIKKVQLVKLLDVMLGIPSILLDSNTDSLLRRELYGKAGAHRPKEYGIEYRTLSNFWLEDNDLMEWVYYGVKSALLCLEGGLDNNLLALIPDAEDIINNNRMVKAGELSRSIIKQFVCQEYIDALESYDYNYGY